MPDCTGSDRIGSDEVVEECRIVISNLFFGELGWRGLGSLQYFIT